MSELATWYYVGTFGQLGPLTTEQLSELIEASVVERTTFVWKPGMNDWIQASSCMELMPIFKSLEPFLGPPPFQPPSAGGTTSPSVPSVPRTPGVPAAAATPGFAPAPGFYGSGMPNDGTNPMYVPQTFQRPISLIKSDRSRTLAGILQLLIPGAGRLYLGYSALGVIQLMLGIMTCGALHVWSMIDGILLLSGQVRIDGYGRELGD